MIYLIGSLRNKQVPHIANTLRKNGFEVYDDWFSDGPEADEKWYEYEQIRGRKFQEALDGWHATHVFDNDLFHITEADTGILVLPAGKSAHLELGWMIGMGKKGYILIDKEPDRFDIMYKFADGVFDNVNELLMKLKDKA